MKKILITAAFVFCLLPFCFSEDYVHVLSESKEIRMQSVSEKRMSARLNQAAEDMGKSGGGRAARIGIYDLAFGAALDEYRRLNAYGVIMISAQTHDAGELPVKDVYFKTGGKKYRLVFLLSKPVKTMGDAAESAFGKYRIDSFYLFPYAFSGKEGELCMDWKKNRKGFVAGKFPGRLVLDFVKIEKDKLPDKNNRIDAQPFKKFLAREFSFSAGEAQHAIDNMKKQGVK